MTTAHNENWGAEPWRAPPLADGDTLVCDEYGRILDKIDFRSHYLRLVRDDNGRNALLVRHGGGVERLDVGYRRTFGDAVAQMGTDDRYRVLYALYDTARRERTAGEDRTRGRIYQAFVDGRLRKRKNRGAAIAKVWEESIS